MKTQSNEEIQAIQPLGNGKYYINYFIHSETDSETGNTVYSAETVKLYNEPTQANVINAIIRERYSASEVEAILNNKAVMYDVASFVKLQGWRKIAKAVSQGIVSKSDLEAIANTQLYKVTLPFNLVLPGQPLAELRERITTLGLPYEAKADTNTAIVWLNEIYQDDMTTLQAVPGLTVEMVNTYDL